MSMQLHTLSAAPGARRRKLRIGRGLARKGKTSGRGMKGQRARAGGAGGLKVKSLRHTLLRVPKSRGFTSPRTAPVAVNLSQLEEVKGAVTPKTLVKAGLITDATRAVKVLGRGDIARAVVVRGCLVSASARQKIEAAGGKVE